MTVCSCNQQYLFFKTKKLLNAGQMKKSLGN